VSASAQYLNPSDAAKRLGTREGPAALRGARAYCSNPQRDRMAHLRSQRDGDRFLSPSPAAASPSASRLATVTRNELREGLELLLEKVSGGVVFELAGLVIELSRASANEDFRFVEREGIEEDHPMRRKSYCTRPPPSGPGEVDWIAIGLPAKGWFGRRDT
jgi:hypothetical protein